MTAYRFPLGGVSQDPAAASVSLRRRSPASGLELEVLNHEPTKEFSDCHSHLELVVRQQYTPWIDLRVAGEELAQPIADTCVRDYWGCLQLLEPSRCYLKVWYNETGAAWGTLRQGPSDNPRAAARISTKTFSDALDVWECLQVHRATGTDSHLLRAFPWLYRAYATQASDVRLRALLFAMGLEATTSPDSYCVRLNRAVPKSMKITKRFAYRLEKTATRLSFPGLPRGWSYNQAAKLIYGLRSTLVHGDSILTDWQGVSGLPASEIDAIAADLYSWMAVAAGLAWTSAVRDKAYTALLAVRDPKAADYWE